METPCNAIAMPKQYAGSPSVPYRQTPLMMQMMMPRASQFVNAYPPVRLCHAVEYYGVVSSTSSGSL
jgi:hypothetical protein